jgi:MFS transporter, DHA2 family, multidrug resistance protein
MSEPFKIVPHRKLITVCTMIATLMQALDSTIANVALPYMQGSLSTTSDQITWVLTSYIVAAAIMTSPVGWLSSRYGRKNFFIMCLAGFTIASMLCGVAQSLTQMVVFRLLQGVFGAALVPLSQSTMLDLYPIEQRGSAMAMWGMGVMVGPILGPTLGGYLTDMYNWRWVFFINLPFGVAAIVGLVFFLRDDHPRTHLSFDWTGFMVLSIGIGALQLLLDRGELLDWFSSKEIMFELLLTLLGLYLFVVHTALTPHSFISARIFKDINFSSGLVVMFAIGVVLLASSALLAPYLQIMSGYPVSQAGVLMVPRGLGTMVAMIFAGKLTSRTDPRLLMLCGISCLAFSFWHMAQWTPAVTPFTLTWQTAVQGFGLGMVFIPLQVMAFATLPPQFRTDGTALFSLVRNVGSAVGVSVTSFMLAQNTQIAHSQLAEFVTPFNRMLQTGGSYLLWNSATVYGLAALNHEITYQALVIAYADDFMLMFWVSVPTALLLLLMRRSKVTSTQPAPTHAAMD